MHVCHYNYDENADRQKSVKHNSVRSRLQDVLKLTLFRAADAGG